MGFRSQILLALIAVSTIVYANQWVLLGVVGVYLIVTLMTHRVISEKAESLQDLKLPIQAQMPTSELSQEHAIMTTGLIDAADQSGISTVTVDLADEIKRVIKDLRLYTKSKNIGVTLKVMGNNSIVGDRIRLRQLFWNLMVSAVELTALHMSDNILAVGKVEVFAYNKGPWMCFDIIAERVEAGAIAKWIVTLHKGYIRIKQGRLTIALPIYRVHNGH